MTTSGDDPTSPEPPPRPVVRGGESDPPRCPRCLHVLLGQPVEGACPECGERYSSVDRYAYMHGASVGGLIAHALWPVLLTPIFFGCVAGGGGLGLFAVILLILGNSMWVGNRIARERRILHLRSGGVVADGAGLVLHSIGCGVIVAIAVVAAAAVSCMALVAVFFR